MGKVKTAIFMEPIPARKQGLYEKAGKRILDIFCALTALLLLWPIYLIVAVMVKIKIGSPILFTQDRPGQIGMDGKETIFKMYKFRTMTNETDENGKLLPDEIRLTKFGKWLRSTSLDELPETFNILNGTMSVIGPRPQLVRDMVFMTEEQRQRHTAKPGLSGLAQVNGRNAVSWEKKLDYDLVYIEKVCFLNDMKILFQTIGKVFVKKEGITQGDMATAEDYGDYLLRNGKVTNEQYHLKLQKAREILDGKLTESKVCSEKFSVQMCVYHGDNAEWFQTAVESVKNQTRKPDEIVLVVDGPVDEELTKIIKSYEKESLFRVIWLEKNRGLGIARKVGLEHCKYDIVAMMDSDDISISNRFELQMSVFMNNSRVSVVGSYIAEFVDNPQQLCAVRSVQIKDKDIKNDLKRRCPMNHPSVMLKKSVIELVGGYTEWFCNEDYYLWIRLAEAGAIFENVAEVLVKMRMTDDSYQRRGGWKYFQSEAGLQKMMLQKNIISVPIYLINVGKRFVVQIVMTNSMRKFVFEKFARKKIKG